MVQHCKICCTHCMYLHGCQITSSGGLNSLNRTHKVRTCTANSYQATAAMLEFKVRVAPSLSLWLWQHLSLAHNSLQEHEYHLVCTTHPLQEIVTTRCRTPGTTLSYLGEERRAWRLLFAHALNSSVQPDTSYKNI